MKRMTKAQKDEAQRAALLQRVMDIYAGANSGWVRGEEWATAQVIERVMLAETAVKWLRQVAEEIRAEGNAGWGNTLDDVCAMLAGKVLCDAEPVAWMNPHTDEIFNGPEPGDLPLYAPASLAGNADILPPDEAGKEGGNG